MSDTVDVNTMLAEEAKQIKERREHLESRYKGMKKLEDDHYLGLAFSGGGIRSGTFNLGILQGLTRIGLLPYVDYLSTVSGGGYIGTWLHGVIKRHDLEETEKILERPDCERHLAPDEDPVAYLRQYSRYLAPELGLFSADFWVILAIWLRNVLLNQLMLIPFLALLILGALHVGYLRHVFVAHANPLQWILCLLLLLLGVVTIAGTGVRSVVNPTSCKERENNAPSRLDRQGWAVACAALVMSASVIVGSFAGPVFRTAWSWKQYVVISTVLFLLFVALQAIGGFLDCYKSQHSGHIRLSWLWLIIFPLAAATLTAGLLCVAMSWIAAWNSSDEAAWHVVAYGPPLIGLVWLAGAGFHIGLMAADFPDAGREWLARVAAFTTILIVGWALIFTVSVFGAVWISRIDGLRSKWGISLSGAWVLTTISGVLSGVSKRTGGKTDQHGRSDLLEVIAKVAPAVFVLGLLILMSFGIFTGISTIGRLPFAESFNVAPTCMCVTESTLVGFQAAHLFVLDCGWSGAGLLTICCLLLVALLPLRININEFSMHYFYKNRLVRCYLGASRGAKRTESRLTGFDPCDDFPLSTLLPKPKSEPGESQPKPPYYGPYPILCCTLNLNTGSEMGKLERKGTSFIFTPLYSGYEPPVRKQDKEKQHNLDKNGFRLTCNYSKPQGLDIGTCMGISGAAANPNWGYHTSAPLAFLLTVFNVRLGWWIGNSRRSDPSKKLSPRYALGPLLSELFAQTDANSRFLNLSDGGQFENLGLYELVRRRCRYIIVGDGEQDHDMAFGSLGGAIRKCRVDFGVDIDLDPQPIGLRNGLSSVHCVIGRIKYPKTDAGVNPTDNGWIFYLKASMTGNEPEDVAQYRSVHPDFPHESTGNQFFTESQFESYRQLGLHIVESAFENVTGWGQDGEPLAAFQSENAENQNCSFSKTLANWMECLFVGLEQQWYPPTEVAAGLRSHHAEEYSRLMRRLGEDPELGYLDEQILRLSWSPHGTVAARKEALRIDSTRNPEVERKGFFYCLELIQLVENVWADLRLSEESNRTNPKNGGWMAIFSYWAKQPVFRQTWERASYTYNPLFRQFFSMMQDKQVQ